MIKDPNHDPEYIKTKAWKLKSEATRRATETSDHSKTIITDLTPQLNETEIPRLPKLKTITERVIRQLNKIYNSFKIEIDDIPRVLHINIRNKSLCDLMVAYVRI